MYEASLLFFMDGSTLQVEGMALVTSSKGWKTE